MTALEPKTPTTYCYDLEFLENGRTIELVSIGIVCEDGREYYAVNSEMPVAGISVHDWLCRNVVPNLPLTNREDVIAQIEDADRRGEKFYITIPKARSLGFEINTRHSAVKPRFVIANEVRDFLLVPNKNGDRTVTPVLWAYCSAYDHVGLCQLFGPMAALPAGMPHYTNDMASYRRWLQSLSGTGIEIPEQESGHHNALADARYNMEVLNVLETFESRLIASTGNRLET
jgi:hypothetical protein